MQQIGDKFVIKTHLGHSAGISHSNSVRRYICCYHRIGTDNGSITNMNARHNGNMLTNPDVIAHNGITLQRQFIFHWSNGTSPVATNDIKRIG